MKKHIGRVAYNQVEVLHRLYDKKVGNSIVEHKVFYNELFGLFKKEVFAFHFSKIQKSETNKHIEYLGDLIIETITVKNTIEQIVLVNGERLSKIYYEDVYDILKSMPNTKSFSGRHFITIES